MARSTVLVVEDDELLRESLALIVRGCGYDVLTAVDGEEATAALSTATIDIVLTDLTMPRLDGYGLIRWMYGRSLLQPVLVLSAYDSMESALEALRLGAYDYIAKPFDLADVRAALRRAAASVEYLRTETVLRQRTRELAALNIISVAVNSSLDLDELLARASSALVESLPIAGVLLYLDDGSGALRLNHRYGTLRRALELAPELLALPIQRGVAIGEAQVEQLLGHTGAGPWPADETFKAAIPLLISGTPRGLLVMVGPAEHPIQHDQLHMLEAIGNYLGVAIANARLYSQLRDSAAHLEGLVAERTQELALSRDLLRTIFDGIPGGLLLADAAEEVLASNRAYAGMLGCNPTSLVGQPYRAIWEHAWPEASRDLVQRCLAEAQPLFQRDRLERPGQAPLMIDRYLFPVHDQGGVLIQVIEYLEDVTDRLALERVLAQTDQLAALGKLAATVAHEVNTPLLAIRGCLTLIASSGHNNAARAEYVTLAESELDRAAATIRGILDFYRSDGAERTATSINLLVEKAARILQAECIRRNVAIDLALAPALPTISATPDQVKQVVLSLLMNILEGLDEGGRITVRTGLHHKPQTDTGQEVAPEPRPTHRQRHRAVSSNSYVIVMVEDDGNHLSPGMPAFDALVTTRADKSDLGLAVCQIIMRDHGGTLTVEQLPGGVFRLVVAFPVATPASDAGRNSDRNGRLRSQ